MMIEYIADPVERQARLVEVARDVIRQLDMGRLVPKKGTYLALAGDYNEDYGHPLVQLYQTDDPAMVQEMVKALPRCDVCAMGAIFVSYVEKYDGVAFDTYGGSKSEAIVAKLFGQHNMARVESAFEMWAADTRDDVKKWIYELEERPDGIPPAEQRLRMIMEDIIKNGGRFLGVDPGK